MITLRCIPVSGPPFVRAFPELRNRDCLLIERDPPAPSFRELERQITSGELDPNETVKIRQRWFQLEEYVHPGGLIERIYVEDGVDLGNLYLMLPACERHALSMRDYDGP